MSQHHNILYSLLSAALVKEAGGGSWAPPPPAPAPPNPRSQLLDPSGRLSHMPELDGAGAVRPPVHQPFGADRPSLEGEMTGRAADYTKEMLRAHPAGVEFARNIAPLAGGAAGALSPMPGGAAAGYLAGRYFQQKAAPEATGKGVLPTPSEAGQLAGDAATAVLGTAALNRAAPLLQGAGRAGVGFAQKGMNFLRDIRPGMVGAANTALPTAGPGIGAALGQGATLATGTGRVALNAAKAVPGLISRAGTAARAGVLGTTALGAGTVAGMGPGRAANLALSAADHVGSANQTLYDRMGPGTQSALAGGVGAPSSAQGQAPITKPPIPPPPAAAPAMRSAPSTGSTTKPQNPWSDI